MGRRRRQRIVTAKNSKTNPNQIRFSDFLCVRSFVAAKTRWP
ncbi:hypothetical protein SOVF_062470 [Spinacia oleracea]|nr:hypothetical protein SOVF_062470 [Spinacia oleracea]